jgi:hypothetical protein
MTQRRQLRRLSDEDFNANFDKAFDKMPGMFQKVQKRILAVWLIGGLLSAACSLAIIYAIIQAGQWFSRQ